jgi:hypothetical protein
MYVRAFTRAFDDMRMNVEGAAPHAEPAISPPHGAIDERPIACVFDREEADFTSHMHVLRSSLNNVHTPESSTYLCTCLADLT